VILIIYHRLFVRVESDWILSGKKYMYYNKPNKASGLIL